jgi:hypothetical protein
MVPPAGRQHESDRKPNKISYSFLPLAGEQKQNEEKASYGTWHWHWHTWHCLPAAPGARTAVSPVVRAGAVIPRSSSAPESCGVSGPTAPISGPPSGAVGAAVTLFHEAVPPQRPVAFPEPLCHAAEPCNRYGSSRSCLPIRQCYKHRHIAAPWGRAVSHPAIGGPTYGNSTVPAAVVATANL